MDSTGKLKSTLKGTMNGTLSKTLYSTAKSTYNFGVHSGTGTTLEITSHDTEKQVTISGYKETIYSLHLPEDFFDTEKVEEHGGGYVTVNMTGDTYICRWQLNDLLNGMGWKLIGYSTGGADGGELVRELWSYSSTQAKSKKGK